MFIFQFFFFLSFYFIFYDIDKYDIYVLAQISWNLMDVDKCICKSSAYMHNIDINIIVKKREAERQKANEVGGADRINADDSNDLHLSDVKI